MGKMLKWQEEYVALVNKMNNRQLLDEVYECCEPDDFDGEMTGQGMWKQAYVKREIEGRLADWLNK